MPSRRQLLVGGSLSAAAVAGSSRSLDLPITVSRTTAVDWPMARYDAAGTGYNPAASGPKDGATPRWVFESRVDVRGPNPPILVGDTLFVAGQGALVALERATGRVRFTRRCPSQSSPAHARASAYRADTLAVTGRQGISGLSAGGGYELLGRSIGTERWYAPGQPSSARLGFHSDVSAPVALDDTIYAIVPETNRVVAIDANSGRIEWEYAIGDERSSHPNQPAVRDGTVYVSSSPASVVALDADTGTRRWRTDLEYRSDDGYLYGTPLAPTATSEGLVVPRRQAVSLLDPSDGHTVWEYVHDGSALEGRVAVADGRAFLTDGHRWLHAIDLETGEREWTYEYGRSVDPVVADGVVYLCYDWLDEVVAVDAESGTRRWTYEFGFEETVGYSFPVVGDGVLYVAGPDRVVALEEGSEGTDR